MAKWVEVVYNSNFGKDSREEIMLGHVEEVTESGKESEGVPDVVGVGGVRQHEGRLEACPVGEAVSGGAVIEVDEKFT